MIKMAKGIAAAANFSIGTDFDK